MNNARSHANVGYSLIRPLKELYLSIFVLFYGISGWKGRMKAGAASLFVSGVVFFVVLALWAILQTIANQYVAPSRWIVGGAGAAIAMTNDYFLVIRGYGIAFDKRFHNFSKNRRIALYLVAIGMVAATGIAFYLAMSSYHENFHFHRK